MTRTIWSRSTSFLVLFLALVCLAPLVWAQDGLVGRRLVGPGWQQIGTHIFQRHLEDGTVQTVGWGLEMVAWQLDHTQERIETLEELALGLDEEPSTDLIDALSWHRARARELQAELVGDGESRALFEHHSGALSSIAGALGCELIITRNAYAYPTTSGPAAQATAAFSDTCNTFGKVMASAYAEGHYNGAFRSSRERDPATGRRSGYGSASASASASVVATTGCYSTAEARVWVQDANGNMVPFVNVAFNDECRIVLPPLPGDCLSAEGLAACEP